MNNLNSVLLEGNLTRDPELVYTPEGTVVCSFRIESRRHVKQEDQYVEEVSLFDVITRSHLAEVCGEYLKSGRGVRAVGRLEQQRDFDGTGSDRIVIVAEHVEFKPERKPGQPK